MDGWPQNQRKYSLGSLSGKAGGLVKARGWPMGDIPPVSGVSEEFGVVLYGLAVLTPEH